MQDVLHWLLFPQCIIYRVSALVRRCIEDLAALACPHLREHCCPLQWLVSVVYLVTSYSGVTHPIPVYVDSHSRQPVTSPWLV